MKPKTKRKTRSKLLGTVRGYAFSMDVQCKQAWIICESPSHADLIFWRLNGVKELNRKKCRWVKAKFFSGERKVSK